MIPPALNSNRGAGADLRLPEYQEAVEQRSGDLDAMLGLFGPTTSLLADFAWFDIEKGDVVADIGAGTGMLALRALRQGVAFGRWYAVEIDPASVDFMAFLLSHSGHARASAVVPRPCIAEDVGLPPASVDVFLVIDVRPLGCEPDENTVPYLLSVRKAAAPGARLHHLLADSSQDETIPERACNSASIAAVYAAAGFELVESRVEPMRSRSRGVNHLVFQVGR